MSGSVYFVLMNISRSRGHTRKVHAVILTYVRNHTLIGHVHILGIGTKRVSRCPQTLPLLWRGWNSRLATGMEHCMCCYINCECTLACHSVWWCCTKVNDGWWSLWTLISIFGNHYLGFCMYALIYLVKDTLFHYSAIHYLEYRPVQKNTQDGEKHSKQQGIDENTCINVSWSNDTVFCFCQPHPKSFPWKTEI